LLEPARLELGWYVPLPLPLPLPLLIDSGLPHPVSVIAVPHDNGSAGTRVYPLGR
jgi:hypothetical protein